MPGAVIPGLLLRRRSGYYEQEGPLSRAARQDSASRAGNSPLSISPMRRYDRYSLVACLLCVPLRLRADTGDRAQDTGLSAIWLLANLCYAGMRAQNSENDIGRALAFLLGLPGTLLTLVVVEEGSERAYGVDLPRASRRDPGAE
jgi:hypothetical protein